MLGAILALACEAGGLRQGVSLYRVAYSMINAVATIWIPPSTMNTPAWIAMACAVVRRYVGRPGQPGAGQARDLCDGQHRWLTCSGRLVMPGSPGVTSSAGGAASSWYGVLAAPVDTVII